MIIPKQMTFYGQALWGPNTFPTRNQISELKNQDFFTYPN